MKILNYKYTIKDVPSLTNDNGDSLFGKAIHTHSLIEVDQSLNKALRETTIIHEALHAYDFQLKYWDKDNVEMECDRLATIIYDFIINNKDFIREMINDTKD